MEDELERYKKLNNKILSIASHDLKSPLAVVQNYLQVILEGYTGEINEKQRNMLNRSSLRIKELLNIIDDILYFRIEKEQMTKDIKEVNLKEVLESCKDDVLNFAEEKGVKLNFNFPENNTIIFASENHLKKVLNNLLKNAIVYSNKNGEINIGIRDGGAEISIIIEDEGEGISEEDREFIFEEFYRGKNVETRGVGLGLSVVKKIVEAHQGKISVESKVEGKGSKFEIILPKGGSKNGKEKNIDD